MPLVALALTLLVHAAVFGGDVVAAQAVAQQAARIAAVEDDAAVTAAVSSAAGGRVVDIAVEPPSPGRAAGDEVTVTVRLRSRAFAPFGAAVWIPARATFRVERP